MNNEEHPVEEIIELLDSDDEDNDLAVVGLPPPMATSFHLVIPGQPRPLERARFFNGGIANRSQPTTRRIKAMALAVTNHSIMFEAGIPVSVIIDFYRARPCSDFVARRRLPGNLKPKALLEDCIAGDPADIDNLAKLILDALNKAVYQDDRQVVSLAVRKLRDSEGTCMGRTVISVSMYSSTIIS